MDTLDKQIDGSHYKDMGIQPWIIIEKNKLDYWHGAALKYLLRWQVKDGIVDLDKIIHYVEHIKQLALEGHYGAQFVPHIAETKSELGELITVNAKAWGSAAGKNTAKKYEEFLDWAIKRDTENDGIPLFNIDHVKYGWSMPYKVRSKAIKRPKVKRSIKKSTKVPVKRKRALK